MVVQRPSRSGFTLVELMIVIVIIGVMAAAVAPSLTEVLADTRQGAAAQDVIQLSRKARALALGSGIAYMLRFQAASSNNLGAIELYAGMNGKCLQTNWAAAVQAPANGPAAKLGPIEVLDLAAYNPTGSAVVPSADDAGRQVITLRAQTGAGAVDLPATCICYQPNGDSYTMTNNDPKTPVLARQAAFIRFLVSRTLNGRPRGVVREVMFPIGGTARLR